ncbi:hypothetical protein TVAG_211970 [Trichomonas vaginalis G3]|uniref:Uncharacterized protein n=1 Tax=Trichomonas vaginalis (strain ATCC PRA-98 / G3) TaxID=412133 RepID=A2EIF3_TRIV3|nr:hypothetical protein TVAGG3_0049090 [Trichomonas vaginalis G3]EAY07558.1 hypothetical protein TVAG_211970 [Trichomonas vaginalis G3]KAI5541265.1 hypothetical protein TVAGG3_0049090 [Trichomonas vaginalis G3]|eukprot:XP_001319781.1 hypothetical protein [Trichomonas vaginalis G3]
MYQGLQIPLNDAKKYYKAGQLAEAFDCYELVIRSCYTNDNFDETFIEDFSEALSCIVAIATKLQIKNLAEVNAIMDNFLNELLRARGEKDDAKRAELIREVCIKYSDQIMKQNPVIRKKLVSSNISTYVIAGTAVLAASAAAFLFFSRRK